MTATELLNNYPGVADVSSANNALELLNNYPDWEGTKLLNILMQYPNTPIYSSVLETALQMIIPLPEAMATIYHLAPVKMTDEATLKAVKKRLNQLIAQKANTPSHHHSVTSSLHNPIEDEIQSLTQYIKETTLPTGGIKCFHDEDRAAYRRQSAAIRRLLAQAEKDGHHEAVAYIKHHLFQGKQMRWEQ
ncbi:MAG: hypothetical protein CVU50_01970 [Candidatus Cloacimonetes bacterium HGW-Cloacimonetes-3]|jgi:hypothetical protein|nr:MAG: hypothetical protein CVU50_01970 [Candidatus Cloacimonetes bacterium HGW-Cloacimonetes-3]